MLHRSFPYRALATILPTCLRWHLPPGLGLACTFLIDPAIRDATTVGAAAAFVGRALSLENAVLTSRMESARAGAASIAELQPVSTMTTHIPRTGNLAIAMTTSSTVKQPCLTASTGGATEEAPAKGQPSTSSAGSD
ncbi:MAG: hypothetical protein WCP28_05965 [Actinomycetes bacterium]